MPLQMDMKNKIKNTLITIHRVENSSSSIIKEKFR